MFEHLFPGEQSQPPTVPESERILQGLLSELPDEAHALVEKTSREAARIEEQTQGEVAHIREQAEQRVSEIESKAENRRKMIYQHAIDQLEPLQKELFRAGELGKALAVFVQIQTLRAKAMAVLPDPGHLLQYQTVGKSYHFRVVGCNRGPVWGSDIYTSDSHLATAAVHAGALDIDEEGVVRVSMVDMSNVQVIGSIRNGVQTMDWGPYRVGYRVTRA